MKIILIRHAKVLVSKKMIYPNEMGEWLENYDLSEIEIILPKDNYLKKIIEDSQIIFCSELQRSSNSLKLYGRTPYAKNKIFNEMSLPYPNIKGFIQLSPFIWRVLFRIMWLFGYSNNGISVKNEKIRAKKSANILIDTAQKNNCDVVFLGHGILNRFIAKELNNQNWISIKKLKNNNWDYGIFQSPIIKE